MEKSKRIWCEFFAKAHSALDHIETGINCIRDCDSLCCPRKDSPPGFIIFLPYELEFIAEQINTPYNELLILWNATDINGTSETLSELKVQTTRQCPFIKDGFCTIYRYRPFDCQTFPAIGNLIDGGMEVTLSDKCPLHNLLSRKFRIRAEALWQELVNMLPSGWWHKLQVLGQLTGDILNEKDRFTIT